jgi:alpha-1,2-mannosyltransferase
MQVRSGSRSRDLLLRLAGFLLIGVAAVAAVILIDQRGLGRDYGSYDFSAYVAAADRLRRSEPLYPQLAAGGFRLGDQNLFLYPPPVALLFLPALLLPFPLASALWGVALTILAVAVALALARMVVPARRPLAVGLTVAFAPLHFELANGNLTLITLALCIVAWRSRAGTWRPAVPLALAAGLKLLAVPLLLPVAIAARRQIVLATASVALGVIVATWPLLGAAWTDWATLTLQLSLGPQTIHYNVVPEPLRAGAGRAILVALTVAVLAACGLLARARRVDPRLAFGAALAAGPYLSAFVLYPYVLFLLPVLIGLILTSTPPWARACGMLAWLLAAAQALDPATAYPSALVATMLAVSAVTWIGARSARRSAADAATI